MSEHKQDRPIDLAGLDPTLDEVRFQGTVRRILDEAQPLLAGRRSDSALPAQPLEPLRELGAVAAIGNWWRPLTAVAAALALGSATLLSGVPPLADSSDSAGDATTFAEALGVPSQLAGWVQTEEAPATAELFELY
ncbi:MAG: hypothetical protein ABFS14_08510 [Gemmatimonadota bacterium]